MSAVKKNSGAIYPAAILRGQVNTKGFQLLQGDRTDKIAADLVAWKSFGVNQGNMVSHPAEVHGKRSPCRPGSGNEYICVCLFYVDDPDHIQ